MTPEQRTLRDALAAVPGRLAASAASAAGLADPDAPPAAGEWSAREVVLHLAAVEAEVWHARLDDMGTGTVPTWSWVEPGLWEGPGAGTFEGALVAFSGFRAATTARLDALGADGWARCGRHATYGELDVAGLMRIAIRHDEEHLAQVQG